MIAEQQGRCVAAYAHRYALAAGVVVFDHRAHAAGPLEVGADVVGGHAVQHGFDAVAIASTYSNPFVVWQMEVSSIIGIQRLISDLSKHQIYPL